jgi:hypothetical protein
MRTLKVWACSTVLCITGAATARAQYPQYIFPGNLGLPTATTEQTLLKSMGDAPWRLGAVRVQPWLGLRDVAYIDNVFGSADDPQSDLTLTFGAGLKAYLPVGEKVVLAAHILPEYVWWRDNDQLSDWHYRYGAGVFGFFNRMTLEVKGHATEQQGYVSAELERLEVSRTRGADALVDVDIAGPFAFFAQAGVDKFDHGLGDTEIAFNERLDVLDRDETFLRGGVKYNLGEDFSIGLGYEKTEASFDSNQRDRSNSGSGPVLVIHKAGSRVSVETNLGYRDIEADNGSEFQKWNALSGTGSVTFKPAGNFIYSLYGARNVVYSLYQDSSYFDDQKVGGSIEAHLGWRTALRGYYEDGKNDYEPLPGTPHRIDDFKAWGGDLQVKLSDQITLVLGITEMSFDSNLPGFDRDVTAVRTRLNFGGDFGPF